MTNSEMLNGLANWFEKWFEVRASGHNQENELLAKIKR